MLADTPREVDEWQVDGLSCRTPVALIFENLQDGMAVDGLIDQFPITREQIRAVLEFAARSLEVPVPAR